MRGSAPARHYTAWDEFGWEHPLFNRSVISRVELRIAPSGLLDLMEGFSPYQNCTARFSNAAVDETLECRVRLKGALSREFIHKSLKLKFARTLFQQRKMSFKASAMDPSMLREMASADLLYAIGAPVQRMSYYTVFVNGDYFGLYLGMEDLGSAFLKSRFEEPGGAFAKCAGVALRYWGPLSDATYDKYRLYDMKQGNLSAVVELARVMSTLNATLIESVFDVQGFLRTLAVEVMTGNWDGIYNSNNYLLFWDAGMARWRYMRYDLDLSLGVSLLGQSPVEFSTSSVFQWAQAPWVRLLMKDPRYVDALWLVVKAMSAPDFVSKLRATLAWLSDDREQDQWRGLDFNYAFPVFEASIDANVTAFVPYVGFNVKVQGLRAYVGNKTASAKRQLEAFCGLKKSTQ